MIIIGVGANVPSVSDDVPIDTCERALSSLKCVDGLNFVTRSRWFRSSPVPPANQPDFINGVARFEGDVPPVRLLGILHALETMAGRVRTVRNAPRPLDLDLISFDNHVVSDEKLILPHPRAHERRFVLEPLLEVAPEWLHPETGLTPAEMIALLPDDKHCAPLEQRMSEL